MHTLNTPLLYIAAFVVVIGVLVFIHELGHYLAARWCGVKVLRFSLGFGPVVWQRRFGSDATEWALSLVPLGGYVKMLDEREGTVPPAELSRSFNRQSVGRRSLIVGAGPAANFLAALLLYWCVFMLGSNELLPVLGQPPGGTPAAQAGLQDGEQVRSVDGQPVATWADLRWILLNRAVDRESVDLEVINERHEIALRRLHLAAVADQGWQGDAFEHLGLALYRPRLPPRLGKVLAGGPAAQAGLQSGDRIVAVAQQPVEYWHEFVAVVRDAGGRNLALEVQRGVETFTVNLVPDEVSERGRTVGKIGVAVAEPEGGLRELRTFVRHGPLEAMTRAIDETWEKSVFSLVMMGKMLIGEASLKNLSGPVTIADYAGQSARLGLDYYLKFMALVSVSLGVLNLLPLPVLDGGHLMYHMIEVVRRRPLSERAMQIGQQIGLSVLLVLMAFALFNDLNRLFSG
ncbi:RIP metalloprotease RseP [Dechloromonas sp. ZY10]|uniref:RIP metalloprotease RseP n=1 Tax=Dechloromonas aquae TaxID=2664436 RepID=UPI0035293991